MSRAQGEQNKAAATAPEPDQDHSSQQHDHSLCQSRYWIVTFDGKRLRQRRLELGLSQERLSYRSGVSLGTIQRVERLPVARCHVLTLQRLASALNPDSDSVALIAKELTENATTATQPAATDKPQPRTRADRRWQETKPFPPDKTSHPHYDAAMARELLADTGEFPITKGGMIVLLTKYRHALYDLATEPTNGTEPA
jgi:transcriptional regulator with XRE-family HTH domain